MSTCAVAGVAARLILALQECNISYAVWLPCGGFLPGGLCMAGLVAILVRAALMAVAWS